MASVKYHVMTEPELTPPTLSQSVVPYNYSFKSHALLCLTSLNLLNDSLQVDNVFAQKLADFPGALNLTKWQVQAFLRDFLAILPWPSCICTSVSFCLSRIQTCAIVPFISIGI